MEAILKTLDSGRNLLGPFLGPAILVTAIFVGWIRMQYFQRSYFPIVNPASRFEWISSGRRRDFFHHSWDIIQKGHAMYPDEPFNIMMDIGEVTILPSKFIDSIRNEPRLSNREANAEDFHAHLPGFEPFKAGTRADDLVQRVARKQLSQSLSKITKPLSDEASHAIDIYLGNSTTEWSSIVLHAALIDVISRMSSRVFLGDELCRDEEWLKVSRDYTITVFHAAEGLRSHPDWLRSIVHWIDPRCREARKLSAKARSIVQNIVQKRQAARLSAIAAGEEPRWYDDALDWFEVESKGLSYDPTAAQLLLSMSAMHTSTDLLTETLFKIIQHGSVIKELREEIIQVVGLKGWSKATLYNLKLMDSAFKETQRLKPISITNMNRKVLADVILDDGNVLRKGSRVNVSTKKLTSPDEYDNPLEWDPHRFARWRGTDKEHISHLVSTSPASLGFGHGRYSCPGRFFAANELKVALCHLLIKYDWKLAPGADTNSIVKGVNNLANPRAPVLVRKRLCPEIDLENVLHASK